MDINSITGLQDSRLPPAVQERIDNHAVERYEKLEKLGEGTYGVVFKAHDLAQGKHVALKKVQMNAWADGVPATALREISILKELSRHPNIVGLHDVFVSYSGNLYLVFELLDLDLKNYLDSGRLRETGLPMAVVKPLMFRLLSGIAACHAHRIIHRDIKPQNVLLRVDHDAAAAEAAAAAAASGGWPGLPHVSAAAQLSPPPVTDLKIADFGLARTFTLPVRPYTHEVVTLWYRSPEILLGTEVYTAAVDVWSAGCILAEMASGTPLFTGDSEVDQLMRIFRAFGTPSASLWPGAQALKDWNPEFPKFPPRSIRSLGAPHLGPDGLDLLARMLCLDPLARISSVEALRHPFFDDIPAALKVQSLGWLGIDVSHMGLRAGSSGGGAGATPTLPASPSGGPAPPLPTAASPVAPPAPHAGFGLHASAVAAAAPAAATSIGWAAAAPPGAAAAAGGWRPM